jgi:hypothetical protein
MKGRKGLLLDAGCMGAWMGRGMGCDYLIQR